MARKTNDISADESEVSLKKKTKKSSGSSKKFSEHLDKIVSAKKSASEIVECVKKDETLAENSIGMAWQVLFDYFCRTDSADISISELNTIAGIIQKLVSSGVKNMDAATCETKAPSDKLTEAALREIERQLNLL